MLVQYFINRYIFIPTKETNVLINKRMCVLLSVREKLTFSKLVGKVHSSERKFEEITGFEEQKGTRYIREDVHFGIIIFSFLSFTKPCLMFLLNCFVREIKSFYQISLGNEVDFRDIMNVFPNILAKN